MAPEPVPGSAGPAGATASASNTTAVEVRLAGGMMALTRFLTMLQNKRMPVAGLSVVNETEEGGRGVRITLLLDCPHESALRYASLLSAMEDVREAAPADGSLEMALVRLSDPESGSWREAAEKAGVGAHGSGGNVVASGEPERLDAWLREIKDETEDVVRFGPVVAPGEAVGPAAGSAAGRGAGRAKGEA
jgi:hypothetical protein